MVRPFATLAVTLVIVVMLTGCKTDSQSGTGDDQKALVSLANSLPSNFAPDEHASIDAGLDSRTRTVRELADIFMTNRDWTESLPQKQVGVWQKSHPFGSAPVIIHEKQSDAAYRLIEYGPKAKAAAPAIIQSLTNSESLTHQWALHQKGIDPLTEKAADASNRHWAIQVLQAIGSASAEVVPALVSVLHGNHGDGFEAANALIIISLSDTNVLPMTIAKLQSEPDSPEAENSVRVLNGIGAEAAAAVPVLIQTLERSNACDMVVSTFCGLGSNASPAVPSLLRYYQKLGNYNYAQQRCLVIALGKIGPGAEAAVPVLKGLLNRTDESFEAVRALWRIDPQFAPNAIAAAEKELRAQATMLRSPACNLLGEIGPAAKSAVPLLLQKLDSPQYPSLVFHAAWALWRIDPSQKSKVIPVFDTFYTNKARYPYEDLSVAAAGALWQIEPERRDEVRPDIIAMLGQWKAVPAIRSATAEMKPLLPALQDIAVHPYFTGLRPWATLAIRQIQGSGTESCR